MGIKTRLDKLEQRNSGGESIAVLILYPSMKQEQALEEWKAETDKPEPDMVVFIQRFTERPIVGSS